VTDPPPSELQSVEALRELRAQPLLAAVAVQQSATQELSLPVLAKAPSLPAGPATTVLETSLRAESTRVEAVANPEAD